MDYMICFPNYIETIYSFTLVGPSQYIRDLSKGSTLDILSEEARATKPNIPNLPFHSSAFEVIHPSDLDSTLIPLNKEIRDARDSTTLVPFPCLSWVLF